MLYNAVFSVLYNFILPAGRLPFSMQTLVIKYFASRSTNHHAVAEF